MTSTLAGSGRGTGRARWVAPLLLVLLAAAAGACLGVFAGPSPAYRSTGLIHIRFGPLGLPTPPPGGGPGPVPMFEAFLQSQVALITSQRVRDMAMQQSDWTALGRGQDPATAARFAAGLAVTHPRNTEVIQVSFTDRDPAAARARTSIVCILFLSRRAPALIPCHCPTSLRQYLRKSGTLCPASRGSLLTSSKPI